MNEEQTLKGVPVEELPQCLEEPTKPCESEYLENPQLVATQHGFGGHL
jgi:hypothetical protein